MAMLTPVSRTTLSEQVALQIVDMISAGRWKPGERLPSESALCQALQIGRSTLREALKSLAFVGRVRMRAGEGTYVAEGLSKFLDRVLAGGFIKSEKDVSELSEARILLETELAALCAQRATQTDLQKLERLVAGMRESLHESGERFLELDLEFHLTIAACSQNQFLAQFLRTIRGLLQEWIMKSSQVPGSRDVAYAQHLKIFEALKSRQPRKARAVMRSHLQTFRRGYLLLLKASESETKEQQVSESLAGKG